MKKKWMKVLRMNFMMKKVILSMLSKFYIKKELYPIKIFMKPKMRMETLSQSQKKLFQMILLASRIILIKMAVK